MDESELYKKSIDELFGVCDAAQRPGPEESASSPSLQDSLAHAAKGLRDTATGDIFETGDGLVEVEAETYVLDNALAADIVKLACSNLGRTKVEASKLANLLENEEWFQSVAELREALADLSSWVSLRLPTRLKVKIKRLILWRLVFDEGERQAS